MEDIHLNIILATSYNYPHLGGLSVHIATLKAGLEARGHFVKVLSFSDVPKWKRDLTVRGPAFLLNKADLGSGYVYTLRERKKAVEELIKTELQHKDYDIINAQDVFATFAALETNIPVASTVHGYLTFEGISKGAVRKDSDYAAQLLLDEKSAYQSTGQIITVDTRIRQYIERTAGVTGVTVRNFIDVENFKPQTDKREMYRDKYGYDQDAFIFFIPRRLTKKNGVIYPIHALKEVIKRYPQAQLIFAGTGEMKQEMLQLVEQLELTEHVHLIGAVDHKDIMNYYALSNAVIIPSIHSEGVEEATSISALEGMGSGLPVIASAVGGLKEIIQHGVDGLLTEEQNIEDLAQAFITLIEQPTYGQQLASAAREKIIKDYSHLSAAESYETIYQQTIDKH